MVAYFISLDFKITIDYYMSLERSNEMWLIGTTSRVKRFNAQNLG